MVKAGPSQNEEAQYPHLGLEDVPFDERVSSEAPKEPGRLRRGLQAVGSLASSAKSLAGSAVTVTYKRIFPQGAPGEKKAAESPPSQSPVPYEPPRIFQTINHCIHPQGAPGEAPKAVIFSGSYLENLSDWTEISKENWKLEQSEEESKSRCEQ